MGCFCASSIAVGPSSAISKSYFILENHAQRLPRPVLVVHNQQRAAAFAKTLCCPPQRCLLLAINGSVVQSHVRKPAFLSNSSKNIECITHPEILGLKNKASDSMSQPALFAAFQCLPGRDFLESLALIKIQPALNHRPKRPGQPDESVPTGLSFVPPPDRRCR